MAGPHIFGSSFVTCFMSFMISKQSWRFCSPSTLLKNSSTLASFTFVFISAIFGSFYWLKINYSSLVLFDSSGESNGLRHPSKTVATPKVLCSGAVMGGVFIEHNQTFQPLGRNAYFSAFHNIWCIYPS